MQANKDESTTETIEPCAASTKAKWLVGLETQPTNKCLITQKAMWVWSLNQPTVVHLVPSSDQGFQLTSQIWADMCGGYGMMMDPYPHPQHLKVVKPLSYVWSGYENHSMWVWSLKHFTRASFGVKQQ